ncbi:MAG: GDSL-type esterase/lipase family protein [Chitinophagaceae bacterium]
MVAKLVLLCLFVFSIILLLQIRNRFLTPRKFTLLALGDSYSIGEGVESVESFSHQAVEFLQRSGYMFAMPDVLARTGWTAQDLLAAIKSTHLKEQYSFVTLLIGVNNQFQELDLAEYESTFRILLRIAIRFAGGNPGSVYVLSIPDWSKTPFASKRNGFKISLEIKNYNALNQRIAESEQVNFLATTDPETELYEEGDLAEDELHPSGKIYARWARLLTERIQNQLA